MVEEGRVIYLYRNPRDTAVSWYHFQRMNTLYGFTGTFAQFLDLFLRGDVAYGDYMQSVLSRWALRGRANVLVLSYEELSRNLPAAVRRIASSPAREEESEPTSGAELEPAGGARDGRADPAAAGAPGGAAVRPGLRR